MEKIRIILIEDNRLLREGINALLKLESDFKVVATFDDGEFAEDKINELNPHILLLDLGLSNTNSLELANSLKDKIHKVKVIVMDLIPIQEEIALFVEAGVKGFILKDATIDEFAETIRNVAAGQIVLPPILAGSLFSQIVKYGLKEMGLSNVNQYIRMTNRECEIVGLIAKGFTNKEIANQLNISVYTVKSHVHNILEKMELDTRVQIAINAHIVEPCSD